MPASPLKIKRFKSEDRFPSENFMKVSDGETAYSKNNVKNSSELLINHNSPPSPLSPSLEKYNNP